jgi:glycosyltransferase involved in cell wall biosynthesis
VERAKRTVGAGERVVDLRPIIADVQASGAFSLGRLQRGSTSVVSRQHKDQLGRAATPPGVELICGLASSIGRPHSSGSHAATRPRMTVATKRKRIAFLDYPDVFEDFYPHYGVDQFAFATTWDQTGNHAFLKLIQREIGDVVYYPLSLRPVATEARHETTGCTVRFLPSSWLHRQLWKLFYLPRSAWRWRSAYPSYALLASYLAPLSWPLLRSLWLDRPDFIFLQDYSSGKFDVVSSFAMLLRVPVIAYHSGSELKSYHGRIARRWTLPRAHRLIASGRAEAELLAGHFRVPKERITVVLTPIDTMIYAPLRRETAARAAGLDPSRRYILFVGRLHDGVKRVSAIIRAFASLCREHSGIDLLIAGDGPDRLRLESLASDLAPARVQFLGWISDARSKAQLYTASECLVIASQREGFPTVVGEALACGTPVLATDVGSISELVSHEKTGWLLPPGDDDALTGALTHIMRNPSLIEAMRPQARNIAQARVSPEAVTDGLRSCFE